VAIRSRYVNDYASGMSSCRLVLRRATLPRTIAALPRTVSVLP